MTQEEIRTILKRNNFLDNDAPLSLPEKEIVDPNIPNSNMETGNKDEEEQDTEDKEN